MIINPATGFWGTYGTQAVGPALDYLLANFNVESNELKEVLLEDFKNLILTLRVHAVSSALKVLQKPKLEYSEEQSLEELFAMWSNSFWTGTLGQRLDDQEYYKALEISVKEEINFEINEVYQNFFTVETNRFGELPPGVLEKLVEFVYIVRMDAVNKLIQAWEEKSETELASKIEKLLT